MKFSISSQFGFGPIRMSTAPYWPTYFAIWNRGSDATSIDWSSMSTRKPSPISPSSWRPHPTKIFPATLQCTLPHGLSSYAPGSFKTMFSRRSWKGSVAMRARYTSSGPVVERVSRGLARPLQARGGEARTSSRVRQVHADGIAVSRLVQAERIGSGIDDVAQSLSLFCVSGRGDRRKFPGREHVLRRAAARDRAMCLDHAREAVRNEKPAELAVGIE